MLQKTNAPRPVLNINDILESRARLISGKAQGPFDPMVADMLRCLCPTITYIIAYQFAKRIAKPEFATTLSWAQFAILFLPKITNACEMGKMRGIALINALLK